MWSKNDVKRALISTVFSSPHWIKYIFYYKNYINNIPNQELNEQYVGIVVSWHKYNASRMLDNIFSKPTVYSVVVRFIKYLDSVKKKYSIKIAAKEDELKRFISDDNCIGIAVFGHGSRHSWVDSESRIIYYCELTNYKNKEFVCQFHCNHGGGKSLVEYLVKNADTRSFVTNDLLTWYEMRKAISNAIKTGSFPKILPRNN